MERKTLYYRRVAMLVFYFVQIIHLKLTCTLKADHNTV
jgi:hypothetical protein